MKENVSGCFFWTQCRTVFSSAPESGTKRNPVQDLHARHQTGIRNRRQQNGVDLWRRFVERVSLALRKYTGYRLQTEVALFVEKPRDAYARIVCSSWAVS